MDFGLHRLAQLRELLSLGTWKSDTSQVGPFVFHASGAGERVAPSAGLEGFIFAERMLSRAFGADAMSRQLQDYGRYLDDLLAPVPWAQDARRTIQDLLSSPDSDAAKYERLTAFVRRYTENLREELASLDQSRWVRSAGIYEIFPRAYNLAGKRAALGRPAGGKALFFADFGMQDILDIKGLGFDTIWVMGIFPIGERNRSGTAGGSPYSIQDHAAVNPDLGTPEDFRGFVSRVHQAGMRLIIDFVPNHAAMDSRFLLDHPDFFLHKDPEPAHPDEPDEGYFAWASRAGRKLWLRYGGYEVFGSVNFWNDTAQLDYSQESLRREMARIVRSWVERFGVDGFRVDMAYLDLNANFTRAWGVAMPQREFLEELISTVKAGCPATAFIAESYDDWDELSACGFDLIYAKNGMARPGGHTGWYDALQSRDPDRIRAAIDRAEFLQWQKGGADMLAFIGNHDEAAPARAFGPWTRGAALLTLLLPGGRLFYGSQEIGFDQPGSSEPKSLPFNEPVEVDWGNADCEVARFYGETLRTAEALRRHLEAPRLKALHPQGAPAWVGYALVAPGQNRPGALVLANPSEQEAAVDFHDPELKTGWVGTLPAFGFAVVQPADPE